MVRSFASNGVVNLASFFSCQISFLNSFHGLSNETKIVTVIAKREFQMPFNETKIVTVIAKREFQMPFNISDKLRVKTSSATFVLDTDEN